MMTVQNIFTLLGGPAALGRAIGRSTIHASIMRRRDSIPVTYWPAVVSAAKERGVTLTYDDLVSAHVPAAKTAEVES